MTGRWACCPTARNTDRRRPTARARRLQRDATTRAARTSTRPWAAASTSIRVDMSLHSVKKTSKARLPPSRPPQRPRRRVRPAVPTLSSDDDPLPHSVPGARNSRRADDRTRSILVLAQRFLLDDGLLESRACSSARAAFASPRRTPRTTSTSRASSASGPPSANPPPDAARNSRAAGEDGEDARRRARRRAGETGRHRRRGTKSRARRRRARRGASPSVVVATRRTPNAASPPLPRAMGRIPLTRFDVPPGHPLLRKYAAGEGAGTRPEGGTTLSEALDFQAARRRAARRAPAPGDERPGVDTADRAVAGSIPSETRR